MGICPFVGPQGAQQSSKSSLLLRGNLYMRHSLLKILQFDQYAARQPSYSFHFSAVRAQVCNFTAPRVSMWHCFGGLVPDNNPSIYTYSFKVTLSLGM